LGVSGPISVHDGFVLVFNLGFGCEKIRSFTLFSYMKFTLGANSKCPEHPLLHGSSVLPKKAKVVLRLSNKLIYSSESPNLGKV
jgi:hypothetical protein